MMRQPLVPPAEQDQRVTALAVVASPVAALIEALVAVAVVARLAFVAAAEADVER